MTLNQNDGILLISYSGYFTVYEAKLFQRELELRLSRIQPEEYALVVEVQDIRLSTQDLAPLFEEIKQTYLGAPFRSIYSVECQTLAAAKSKRKGQQRPNWTQVQTVDEALQLVRNGRGAEA
jgi:hypothetical protein